MQCLSGFLTIFSLGTPDLTNAIKWDARGVLIFQFLSQETRVRLFTIKHGTKDNKEYWF